MKVWKTMLWTAMGAGALGLSGCDVHFGGRPRAEVYVQPQYVEPPQYVVVQQAPPPMIVERRPYAPAGAYVWIDGYWNWDGQRYLWVAGRYEVPPQPGVVWVAARYDRDGQGYRYSPGQWRKQDQGDDRGRDRGAN